jgi:5-methylcytosine-specific restriction endonuclease McrA
LGLNDETSPKIEYGPGLIHETLRERPASPVKPAKGRSQRFYSSFAWRRLRYRVLSEHDGRCQACGRGAVDGIVLNVDHIEPLSKAWERRLDPTNLQVLCGDCNHGKLNYEAKDWRVPAT